MKKYNPQKIEKKWQKIWQESGIYKAKDEAREKENYMLLTEFPYPSGNLHIGHWFAFAVPDILARFLRLKGKNVMYPMGFDAFGLPAENAAIKRGLNPRDWTQKNISHMAEQFQTMGGSFDWSRQVSTIDPEYYRWTQWIFLKMLEKGLAYRKEVTVNWCPSCKTVLANEQVTDGLCERCDSLVEQKDLEQWMYKTTDYAERLVNDLENLDWPESTKIAQKNWIGKSEGANIIFKIRSSKVLRSDLKNELEVFTTRLDTIFGCTYCVVAPEHEIIEEIRDKIENIEEVERYINQAKKKTDLQRTDLAKEKTGVEIKGLKAVNPFTNEAVPIFVAGYVLGSYGTGAVMAVPAHDERDWEFARKYKLPVKQVIAMPAKNHIKDAKDRISAAALIFDSDDKILVLCDNLLKKYNFPRGGINPGETAEEASLREAKEETGYFNLELVAELGCIESYFYAEDKKVNLHRFLHGFSLRLKDKKRVSIHEEDEGRYEILWLNSKEAKEKLDFGEDKIFLERVISREKICYIDDGILVNSGKYSGMTSEKAREEMAKWLEKNKLGKKTKTYRLHDWVISRQRYWGVPIPVVYCPHCAKNFPKARPSKFLRLSLEDTLKNFAIVPVPEKDLPVKLPELKDFLPTGDGKSPLAKAKDWVNVKCPQCGGDAKRETDTMDTFVDSSWYFIRYADPKNENKFADGEKMKKWLPVPMYIGGAEHNTMHLLYSRFFTKVLYDLKLIHFDEPFTGRRNHGIILGPDNQKMSKSRENVVDPDEQVKKYGADSVRMYLAFMGPYDQNASWQMRGVTGTRRFLEKVYKLANKITRESETNYKRMRANNNLEILLHKTIKKVTQDIENMRFNTAISALMILVNEMEKQKNILNSQFSILNSLLAPFAPHIAEELWQKLGHKNSIFLEKWPEYDPKLVEDEEKTIIVQINGKMRDQLKMAAGAGEKEVKKLALENGKVMKYMEGKNIRKTIFVKDRLINFVL